MKVCRRLGALPTTSLRVSVEPDQKSSEGQEVANMSTPAMIFLLDNVLLERDLKFDDIKPRLLGLYHPGYLSPTPSD